MKQFSSEYLKKFATCFNSFGGMKICPPNFFEVNWTRDANQHHRLADEIRSVATSNGEKVTMGAMEQMPMMKSVVNEAPVALQYSKPKVVLQYILEGLVEDMD
jgi:hydroperoxide dehydratase